MSNEPPNYSIKNTGNGYALISERFKRHHQVIFLFCFFILCRKSINFFEKWQISI
jgi:hypothetical protein